MKIKTIKKNSEFKIIYKKGKSIAGAYLVLYRYKAKHNEKKFGITISKKVGKAIIRNRIRRLIKEFIRLNLNIFENGYDYVIVSRVRAKDADYIAIKKNLLYLVRQHKKKG